MGPRFRILGGQGGQIPSRHLTRRNDIASASFCRHVPTRFLINPCQIITFLILKSDIIENSRIELRGIVFPVPLNQIKVTFIIILPLPFNICDFFLFHIEIEGCWLVGCFGINGPLRQYFSLYRAVSQREGERKEN